MLLMSDDDTKQLVMRAHKRAFAAQRYNAYLRGIGWQLTFEEWLNIWTESGHFHERGRGTGKYVMARYGDVGPYAVGNVKIITHAANLSEKRPEIDKFLVSRGVLRIPS